MTYEKLIHRWRIVKFWQTYLMTHSNVHSMSIQCTLYILYIFIFNVLLTHSNMLRWFDNDGWVGYTGLPIQPQNFKCRSACSIELPESFILTGGYETSLTKVTKYSTSGWMEDLPELQEGRRSHGCGYFYNDDMERVGEIIRNYSWLQLS